MDDGMPRLIARKEAAEMDKATITELAKLVAAEIRGPESELTLAGAAKSYPAGPNRFVDNLVKHWGDQKIRSIKPDWVRTHAKDIYPNAKPATLNRQVITPLQAIINHAYQSEDGRKIKIVKFPVHHVKKKQAVDAHWHERFAQHAVSPGMAALARFMYETAARVSEACRVMPGDVDLDARTVWLDRTKTTPRLTRVSHHMAALLRALIAAGIKRNRLNKNEVNGVFGYAGRNAVYNGWKTTCDRAGISYSPPHSSGRVSFATELVVRRGIDPVTAAKLGGWASPKVMMDTYAKADGSHDLVDSIFGGLAAIAPPDHPAPAVTQRTMPRRKKQSSRPAPIVKLKAKKTIAPPITAAELAVATLRTEKRRRESAEREARLAAGNKDQS